jgi:hypothetical protein
VPQGYNVMEKLSRACKSTLSRISLEMSFRSPYLSQERLKVEALKSNLKTRRNWTRYGNFWTSTAMTQHVIYQELPGELFQPGNTDIPENILDYTSFESNCCTSYRTPRDPRAHLLKSTALIRARTASEVRTSALAGNASDCLELGLR